MKTVVVLIVALALFSLRGMADTRDRVNFKSDDVYQYSYNEDSIAQSGKNTVKVWVRWEGIDEEMRKRIIDQRDTRKGFYLDCQCSKQLLEINCSKTTMDVVTSTVRKTKGGYNLDNDILVPLSPDNSNGIEDWQACQDCL